MSLFPVNREPTTDPPAPEKNDPAAGTLGIWSTYYDQADPLVFFNEGEWEELTIEKLKGLLK
jgi:hypothetical protein